MKKKHAQSADGFGLLANGSTSRWTIAADESLRCEEWSLEIDGPQVCLVFQLDDMTIPRKILRFLQSELERHRTREIRNGPKNEDALALGRFGSASVSLLRDNEDFPRCFLVAGARSQSTLRLTLFAEDIQQFIEALQQAVEDLPAGEKQEHE